MTVWPSELRQWARSDRGEVIKVERKIAALLAEGERGTSVSLPKPMPRPVRRLVLGVRVEALGLRHGGEVEGHVPVRPLDLQRDVVLPAALEVGPGALDLYFSRF